MESSPPACRSDTLDACFTDPSHVDPEFPPHFTQFCVDSGGSNVPAKMWLAAGRGAKGTVIISPPMGGTETMNSVVIPLMYAGVHVISYRPRGVRDPKNAYSLTQCIDDIHALVDWIVANSGAERSAPFGPKLRLDPERIAIFGLSGGGGNVGYAVCAESVHANYAIAAAPSNIDAQMVPELIDTMRPIFRQMKEATLGRTDFELWLDSMTPDDRNRLSIIKNAPKLVSKHLLLLGASQDVASPVEICHSPISAALRGAGVKDFSEFVLETDHGFMTKRSTLARMMVGWLHDQGF